MENFNTNTLNNNPTNSANTTNNLPLQTFQNISTANSNACQITAQIKQNGNVVGYSLSNGTDVDLATAVDLTKKNQIANVGVATNQGVEYLRSLPDNNSSNNLSNLPVKTIQ